MPHQLPGNFLALSFLSLVILSSILAAWGWLITRLASRQPVLPRLEPLIVPWTGKTVLGVLVLFMILREVLPNFYFYVLLARPIGEKLAARPIDKLLVTSLVNLLFLPLAWLILRGYSRAKASDLGLERGRMGMDVLRGIIAWPILAPIIFGLNFFILFSLKMNKNRLAHPVEQMAGQNPSPLVWAMLFFTAIVVAPVTEEFLFRGVLLGWLGKTMSGAKKQPVKESAIVWDDAFGPNPNEEPAIEPVVESPGRPVGWIMANLTISLVFAALHVEAWPTPIPLFFLAIGLGILYQRTAGIMAPLALHMTFNGISTVVLFVSTMTGGMDALKRELQPDVAKPPAIQKPVDVAK